MIGNFASGRLERSSSPPQGEPVLDLIREGVDSRERRRGGELITELKNYHHPHHMVILLKLIYVSEKAQKYK